MNSPSDCNEIYWANLEQLLVEGAYGVRDILTNWPSYIKRDDLPRFLSHYELFKSVVDLPGCVVDVGVYKGASLFTWTALMETFCPFDVSRRIYGFDSFKGFESFSAEDGPMSSKHGKERGGFQANENEIRRLTELHNSDQSTQGAERTKLIVGDIEETLPIFVKQHPGIKISLLHLDADLYRPTRIALELLYPLVVNGGIICFDEYGLVPWEGETKAIDEYFSTLVTKPHFRKHAFTQAPHAFWIKP